MDAITKVAFFRIQILAPRRFPRILKGRIPDLNFGAKEESGGNAAALQETREERDG
jgi:hypothetical protein